MPKTIAKRNKHVQRAKPTTTGIDLGQLSEAIQPDLDAIVRTLVLAARTTAGEDGEEIPGDVRAATAVLDLVAKHLASKRQDRGAAILEKVREIRAEGAQTGD